MKKLIAGATPLLVAGLLAVPSASAALPRLWTDSSMVTPLRSVSTAPVRQPDALEFDNLGPMQITIYNSSSGAASTIKCEEVELGTTLLVNSGTLETRLALPFGIAEGDSCLEPAGGTLNPTPVYFDTNAAGAVIGSLTISGATAPYNVTIHKLKLSLARSTGYCTANLEGVAGYLYNATGPFTEEAPPNMTVAFKGAPIIVYCPSGIAKGMFSGAFFLETMSTTTDTAFAG